MRKCNSPYALYVCIYARMYVCVCVYVCMYACPGYDFFRVMCTTDTHAYMHSNLFPSFWKAPAFFSSESCNESHLSLVSCAFNVLRSTRVEPEEVHVCACVRMYVIMYVCINCMEPKQLHECVCIGVPNHIRLNHSVLPLSAVQYNPRHIRTKAHNTLAHTHDSHQETYFSQICCGQTLGKILWLPSARCP